jgi:MFS family permease
VSRRTGLVALLTADVISALGTRMSIVAIPWLVLVTTGSPAKMGMVAGTEMLAYVLSATFGPPLADRIGLRRTSIAADVGCTLAMAGIATTPRLGFLPLMVLVACVGALSGVGDRAKHVLLRPMAEAAGARMIRVTAGYEGLTRGATLVGAPLGGLLVFWFDAPGAILVDAVSFAVCAGIVAVFVRPPVDAGSEQPTRERYVTALWNGARWLWQDRVLVGMLGTTFTLNVFAQASMSVFIPLWVADVLGAPAALGLVLGAFAAGAVAGNLVFTALAPRLPQRLTFLTGAMVGGAPRVLVLGVSDNLAIVLVVTFLSGVGIAAINPILGARLYERVPAELQTRVFGLATAVSFVGLVVGGVLAGWTVAGFGLTTTTLVGSAICLVVTAAPLVGYRPTQDRRHTTAHPRSATG